MQNAQTKLKGLLEKIKGFFAKLNKRTRVLLGVCLGVILVLIAAAAFLSNRTDYELLQGGLNASEISNLVQFLDNNGVTDYRVNGDKVYVAKGRAQALQAQLALSGNLNSGFLYEYYTDNKGLTNTQNELDLNWRIAKEQKLEAIIGRFEGVQSADVVIEPGTKQVYVLDSQATPATASVTITPVTSNGVSSNVAQAIRNTVRFGVERLEISNVNIEDIYGNTYSDNGTISQTNEATALKLQHEEQINNKIRSQILQTLGSVYGENNIRVGVNSTVEVSRKIVDKKTYHQPDGSVDGGGLISHDTLFWEVIRDGSEPTGGVVGTGTNSTIPNYPNLENNLDGNEQYAGEQIDRDHVIDITTEQMEVMEGRLTDLRIMVSVNQSCTNAGAMTVEELRNFIAVGSGVDTEVPESHVAVTIAPFDVNTPGGSGNGGGGNIIPGVENWILVAALAGLVLFFILLAIILLLLGRSKKKKQARRLAEEEELRAAEAAAEAAAIIAASASAPTGGADIMDINTEKSLELRKTVRQFAQNNPEIAAQMVKAWLRGEENNG